MKTEEERINDEINFVRDCLVYMRKFIFKDDIQANTANMFFINRYEKLSEDLTKERERSNKTKKPQ